MANPQELSVKLVVDMWHTHIQRCNQLLEALSDEQLLREIAPGKNRGIYLLGHLTAVHDRMITLLGLGERLCPQLDGPFLSQPDRAAEDTATVSELREYWNAVNTALAEGFTTLTPEAWFQRHNAVSEEDFAKEPHRNKLNLLLNRSHHLAYHFGQIVLL
ncbi:MAG: DinB family protein, partial [Bacteroidetes bacterium]